MRIPSINSTINFGDDHKSCVVAHQRHRNNVALSGGLALGLLGTTAVTGIAHARIPHIISAGLAILAGLFHVESLAIRNNAVRSFNA